MSDNLMNKYKRKEKMAEKWERGFSKAFKYGALALMGSILLRFAPNIPLSNIARIGIIASGSVIGISVIGEFASSIVKDHYESKAAGLEEKKEKAITPKQEVPREKELVRTEKYDNYRDEQRVYDEYDVFTRSRPAVRQRMRKK